MFALIRHNATLVLATVIIAAGVLFYVLNQQVAEGDILDECRISDIPEMQKCFTEKLLAFAERHGYRDALLALERAKDKRPDLYYNCHFIAHALGLAAYKHFHGDVRQAMEASAGINVCLSGYYHHVLIEFAEDQNIDPQKGAQPLAEKSCDKLAAEPDKRKLAFDCYHGLGHGIAIVSGYDLPQALKQCDSLVNKNGQFICYGGVFMQNALLAGGADEADSSVTNYFKNGDPFYPCRQVDEKYRDMCYFNAVQQYLMENPSTQTQGPRNKVDGGFALCREAPEKNRPHCFEGLGVFRGYGVGWDVNTVRELCLRGKSFDEQKSCIIGAASRYLRMGRDELIRFCNSLPPKLAAPCRESAKNLYLF